jgi:hypothetical protein
VPQDVAPRRHLPQRRSDPTRRSRHRPTIIHQQAPRIPRPYRTSRWLLPPAPRCQSQQRQHPAHQPLHLHRKRRKESLRNRSSRLPRMWGARLCFATCIACCSLASVRARADDGSQNPVVAASDEGTESDGVVQARRDFIEGAALAKEGGGRKQLPRSSGLPLCDTMRERRTTSRSVSVHSGNGRKPVRRQRAADNEAHGGADLPAESAAGSKGIPARSRSPPGKSARFA